MRLNKYKLTGCEDLFWYLADDALIESEEIIHNITLMLFFLGKLNRGPLHLLFTVYNFFFLTDFGIWYPVLYYLSAVHL